MNALILRCDFFISDLQEVQEGLDNRETNHMDDFQKGSEDWNQAIRIGNGRMRMELRLWKIENHRICRVIERDYKRGGTPASPSSHPVITNRETIQAGGAVKCFCIHQEICLRHLVKSFC